MDQNKIKINIMNIHKNIFEFIVDTEKIRTFLEQSGYEQLAKVDLIENEDVLLVLSSMNIQVKFNPKNKNIIDIMINDVVSDLNIQLYK